MPSSTNQGGEYQFRKCGGKLDLGAVFPYASLFIPAVKDPHILDSPLETVHSIISILYKEIPLYAEFTDNPVLIIREIEKKQLPGKKCAQIFKALYLKSRRDPMRQRDMYKKYYLGMHDLIGYNFEDKNRITKARFSFDCISLIYKDAFYKYSRYL